MGSLIIVIGRAHGKIDSPVAIKVTHVGHRDGKEVAVVERPG